VEKWKSRVIVEMIDFARPQAVWKTLWKTIYLWKKMRQKYFSTSFHRHEFSSACGKVENFV